MINLHESNWDRARIKLMTLGSAIRLTLVTPDCATGPANKQFVPKSGPEVITQLSTKFQLLIKTKTVRQIEKFLALSLSDIVFIMLINVKMPTNVGILTFMSRIKFVLS